MLAPVEYALVLVRLVADGLELDTGVIGGLTQTAGWNKAFDNPNADVLSTIVSIYEIGCAVG